MSKVSKKTTLRVVLGSEEDGTKLDVAVKITKNPGASRLDPIEDRIEVNIQEVFEVVEGGWRSVTRLLANTEYLDTLYYKLLPLAADAVECGEEVAA